MEPKRKLFIYDRREVGILILLGVGVALFAFTLGLHLGKQVNPSVGATTGEHGEVIGEHGATAGEHGAAAGEGHGETPAHGAALGEGAAASGEPVAGAAVAAPSRSEISQEVKNVPGAIEDTLDQTLRDEVTQSGMKVATPKPLQLPKETRAALERDEAPAKKKADAADNAPKAASSGGSATESAAPAQPTPAEPKGATETALAESAPKSNSRESAPARAASAAETAAPVRRASEFALQMGSYPKRDEAVAALRSIEERGVAGEIREAELPGKGKWFRVQTGKYKSFAEADKSGQRLKAANKLDEYIVVRTHAP